MAWEEWVAWAEWIIKKKLLYKIKPSNLEGFWYTLTIIYMNKYSLEEITSTDKRIHQGLYFEPTKKSIKAILWVPGLSSTFYNNVALLNAMATLCDTQGIGLASFNNRGHDLIAGIQTVDPTIPGGHGHAKGGAGYEIFEESIFDIDAGITFLISKGYKKIFLLGHSSGANKACFYAGKTPDSRVGGVILASPLSDRLDTSLSQDAVKKNLQTMKRLIDEGKGDDLIDGYFFFPMTPKRYISLFTPGSLEDTFDYGDEKPKLTQFSKIVHPLLVLMGAGDEYLDRPARKVTDVYDAYATSERYTSAIIPNALHSYDGQETEFAQIVVDWVREE